MDGEAYVGSIPNLQALEGALGHFAAQLLQNLRAAEPEIRRKMAELEERGRQCQLQIVRLHIEYQGADDEDRGYLSQQIEEADEKLRNIRHWQKQVEEHRQVYDRYSGHIKEIAEKDTPKARNFLRRKIDELNGYAGCQMSYPAAPIGAGVRLTNAETGVGSSRLSTFPECSGFEQSQLMSNDDVKAFLREWIPFEHRLPTNVFHIYYTDFYKREGKGYIAGDTLLLRHGIPMAISIYKQSPDGNLSKNSMERTIIHEIGHTVYARALDRGTRNKWNKISNENRLKDDSGEYGCVSKYAAENPIEDFAESYAWYIKRPVDLYDANRRKYVLLREMVFYGREYRCLPLSLSK
jgi:hypothetical protein